MNDYDDFESYMERFKKYSTKEKERIVYNHMKILASLANNICKIVGAKNEMIINRDLVDLTKNDYTQDDYYEALIVLVNSIQRSIGDYHEKVYADLKYLADEGDWII